ncbi:golgin subfamily A member 7 [Anolis carolinensis]|uniref:Golgin subfamily A member 7 n=1 Tax=Anolis carolinensis TaxID=28377 RepID=H9G3X9_ANOCA|nr:PREDICTED: golgin subfamily A member 7 [Anolis carolinensis]|eukprot:XP_003228163.2 PREDICTED: golgin subfamily A member 7 [Anolis carolinensis]
MKVGGVCDRSWKAEEQEEAEEGAAAEGLRLCPLANLDSEMRPPQPPVASKVFVQRDYSSGTKCQFQTKFPPELENRLDRQQFEETVRTLNNLYAEAEKLGSQSYLEGCLACLTAYTIFLCMETHYEKVLKKIAKYVQEQNEKIYAPQGLLLTDPIERGLRVIEITIYEDRSVSSGR